MISLCESIIDGKRRELKEHGSFSFPVACYSNTQQNHSVPCHWHDELEMLILEKGSALLQISFIKQEVKEGDGCFINAGVLHAMEKIPGMKFNERCLVFHPRLIGGSVDSVFWQKYILPLVSDRSARTLSESVGALAERNAFSYTERMECLFLRKRKL